LSSTQEKISERKNRFLFQICSLDGKNIFKIDFGKKTQILAKKNMFFAIGTKYIHMFIVANISTYMRMLCGTGVY